MKNINENLSEILDVSPIELKPDEKNKMQEIEIISVDNNVVDLDTNYARKNIKDLIEKGNLAITDLLFVAKASEHPRAYEVAANMIKNLADLNKDLLEIQKRKKDLEPKLSNNQNGINVEKAVFIGSTKELINALKNKD